jgi:hypothetical protein
MLTPRRASLAVPFSVALLVLPATPALAPPVTLTQVGTPIPGVGPVGMSVEKLPGGVFVLVANYQNDDLRSLRFDPATGALFPVSTIRTGDGPSAVVASKDGNFACVSNLLSNDISALRIDPATGLLTLMGTASSVGSGPSSIALSDDGYVVVANRESDSLQALKLDQETGTLTQRSVYPAGNGPADIAVSGRKVVVGHALSNDVHYLNLDEGGALHPIDVESVGERVTAVGIQKNVAIAATYPGGNLYAFSLTATGMVPLGFYSTGGDITDFGFLRLPLGPGSPVLPLEVSSMRIVVTGINPPRVQVFELGSGGITSLGSLPLTGNSSRTLQVVPSTGTGDAHVVVNEYNNNRTLVVRVSNVRGR